MITVSVMLVEALATAVERFGCPRARFFASAGLQPVDPSNLLSRIPFAQYEHVVQTAYAEVKDPAFGLHLGERMSIGTFDVLGYLVEHSVTLREAITTALRYSGFVSEGPRLEFAEDGERATLRILLPENESFAALLASEFSVVALLRMVRTFAGDDVLPERALFAHPKPAHAAEYRRLFGGREAFSQACSGLVLDRSWLDRGPKCRADDLQTYLTKRAEMLLAKAERDASVTERVERWLAAQPELKRPALTEVAGDLGMSSRSLRRYLSEEHALFSDLVDDARAARAKRILMDPAQSIQETAYSLGFRTASAFSRAFKRWTGMTPRAYRGMGGHASSADERVH